MPIIQIQHRTTYRHPFSAAMSWQKLMLQPRTEHGQTLLNFDLDVRPSANDIAERTDFFGNTSHLFTVRGPLSDLTVVTNARVRRDEAAATFSSLSPTPRQVTASVADDILNGRYELDQYTRTSPAVPFHPAAAELAAGLNLDETPSLDWLSELGAIFTRTFTFDSKATNVSTPLAHVLEHKRGVCQDFSHAMISCLRQLGLPAAYVSGYLLTTPPEGQERLLGADAMHAWVSVYLAELGWVDYDPTNQCFAGTSHVVVARGRDYSDVSPLRGLFRGSASHQLDFGVTVEIEEPTHD